VDRALALEPDVLLLDEAISAADSAARHALFAGLAAEQDRRPLAVCFASHQLEEAYRWSGDILALHQGTPVPVTPENLFRVDLPGPAGMQCVAVGPVTVDVAADRTGPATLAIPPEEIILSIEPLHSSARNVFAGRVVRAAEHRTRRARDPSQLRRAAALDRLPRLHGLQDDGGAGLLAPAVA
jgi:ABC-type sulfate/molybdate transport systems ATPase subunit